MGDKRDRTKRKKIIPQKSAPAKQKLVRLRQDPDSENEHFPSWQLGRIDFDGPWSWGGLGKAELLDEIHAKLKHFESMSWFEILKAAGGKRRGNNNHSIEVANLCSKAQERLKEIGQSDVDTLFSLRLTGRKRVWGIKTGRVLRVLWYDPKHEVCPSNK